MNEENEELKKIQRKLLLDLVIDLEIGSRLIKLVGKKVSKDMEELAYRLSEILKN